MPPPCTARVRYLHALPGADAVHLGCWPRSPPPVSPPPTRAADYEQHSIGAGVHHHPYDRVPEESGSEDGEEAKDETAERVEESHADQNLDARSASSPSGRGGNAEGVGAVTRAGLGLTIHAAVDGVAVGAAAASKTGTSVTMIVFLAVMLHKAPAAFGLSTCVTARVCRRSA